MSEFTRYRVPLIGGIPDQQLTIIIEGISYSVRVFYSTLSQLWWLELGLTDGSVKLSQIILRPNVMRSLNGWLPGYGGNAYVGIQPDRADAEYSLTAFSGSYSLYFFSDAE